MENMDNTYNDILAKAILENKPIIEFESTLPITVPKNSTNIFPLTSPLKTISTTTNSFSASSQSMTFMTPSNEGKVHRYIVDDLQYAPDNSTIQGLTPGYSSHGRLLQPTDITLSSVHENTTEGTTTETENNEQILGNLLPSASSSLVFSPGNGSTPNHPPSKSLIMTMTDTPTTDNRNNDNNDNLSNVSFIPSAVKMIDNPLQTIDDNHPNENFTTSYPNVDSIMMNTRPSTDSSVVLPIVSTKNIPDTVPLISQGTTSTATVPVTVPRSIVPVSTTLTETFEERLKQADLDMVYNNSTVTNVTTATANTGSLSIEQLQALFTYANENVNPILPSKVATANINPITVNNTNYPVPPPPLTLTNGMNIPKLAMIPLQISTSARTLTFVSSSSANLFPLVFESSLNRWIIGSSAPATDNVSSLITAHLPVRNPSNVPLNLSLHIDIGTVTLTPYLNRSLVVPSVTVGELPSVTLAWTIETMNRCFQFQYPDNTVKNNDNTRLLLPTHKMNIIIHCSTVNIVQELLQQSSNILHTVFMAVKNQYTALNSDASLPIPPKGVPLGILDIQWETKVKILCTLGTGPNNNNNGMEERSVFTIPVQGKLGCSLDRSIIVPQIQSSSISSSNGPTPSIVMTPNTTTGFSSGSPPSSIILPEFISQIKPHTSTDQHLTHTVQTNATGTVSLSPTGLVDPNGNSSNNSNNNIEGGQGIFRKVKTNNHTAQTVSTALPNSYPNSRSSTPFNVPSTNQSRSVSPALVTMPTLVPTESSILPKNGSVLGSSVDRQNTTANLLPPRPPVPNKTITTNPLPPAPMVQPPASILSLSQQQQQQQIITSKGSITNHRFVPGSSTTTVVANMPIPPAHQTLPKVPALSVPVKSSTDTTSFVPPSNEGLNISWSTNSIDTEEISLAERYLQQRQKSSKPPTVGTIINSKKIPTNNSHSHQSRSSLLSRTQRETKSTVPIVYDNENDDDEEEEIEYMDETIDPSSSSVTSPYVVRSHGSTVHGFTILKKKGKHPDKDDDDTIAFELRKNSSKGSNDVSKNGQNRTPGTHAHLRSTRLPLSPFSPAKPVTKQGSNKSSLNNLTKGLSPRTAAIIKSNLANLATNTATSTGSVPMKAKGPQRVPIIPTPPTVPSTLPESIYSNHHSTTELFPTNNSISISSTIPVTYTTSIPPPTLQTRNKLSPVPMKRRPPFVTGTSTTNFNKGTTNSSVTSPNTKERNTTAVPLAKTTLVANVPVSPPRVVPSMNKQQYYSTSSTVSSPVSPSRSMNNTLRHKAMHSNGINPSSTNSKGEVSTTPLSSHTYHSVRPGSHAPYLPSFHDTSTDNNTESVMDNDNLNGSYNGLNTSHLSQSTNDSTSGGVVLRTRVDISPKRSTNPVTTSGTTTLPSASLKVSRSISPFPSVRDAATSPFVFGTVSLTGTTGRRIISTVDEGSTVTETVDTTTSPIPSVAFDPSLSSSLRFDKSSMSTDTTDNANAYTLSNEMIQQLVKLPSEEEMNVIMLRSSQSTVSSSSSFVRTVPGLYSSALGSSHSETTINPSSPNTLRRSIDALLLASEESPNVSVPENTFTSPVTNPDAQTVPAVGPTVSVTSQPVTQYNIFSPHRGEVKEHIRKEELLREVAQLERQSYDIMRLQQQEHYYSNNTHASYVPTTVEENTEDNDDDKEEEEENYEENEPVPSTNNEKDRSRNDSTNNMPTEGNPEESMIPLRYNAQISGSDHTYFSPIPVTYSGTNFPSFSPSASNVPKVSPFHLEKQFSSPVSTVVPSPSMVSPTVGTWYIQTESSTIRFPALTNGPDNTPLTNKISIYNSAKDDLLIDIYGPDKEKLSSFTGGNGTLQRFTSPTASSLSNVSPYISLLSLYNQQAPIALKGRRNTYINLRFSLPGTGTRIKLTGYSYHNGTNSLSGILYIRSVAGNGEMMNTSLFENTGTDNNGSNSDTEDMQTVRIILDRKVWEAYGYVYDNVSHTLISTGLMGVIAANNETSTPTTGTTNNLFFTSPLPGSGPNAAVLSSSSSTVKHSSNSAVFTSPTNTQASIHPMNGYGPLNVGNTTLKPSPINVAALTVSQKTTIPLPSPSHHTIINSLSLSHVSVNNPKNPSSVSTEYGIMMPNAHPVEPKQYHEGKGATVGSMKSPLSTAIPSIMYQQHQPQNNSKDGNLLIYGDRSTTDNNPSKQQYLPIDKPLKKPTTFHPASPPLLLTESTTYSKNTSLPTNTGHGTNSNGIHVPLRTVYFPAITKHMLEDVTSSSTIRIRIQICNTSAVPLSMTTDIRSTDNTVHISPSNRNNGGILLPFYIKNGHQQFILQPRSFVMLPIYCNLSLVRDQFINNQGYITTTEDSDDAPLQIHTGILMVHGEPLEGTKKNTVPLGELKLSCRAMVVAEVQPHEG